MFIVVFLGLCKFLPADRLTSVLFPKCLHYLCLHCYRPMLILTCHIDLLLFFRSIFLFLFFVFSSFCSFTFLSFLFLIFYIFIYFTSFICFFHVSINSTYFCFSFLPFPSLLFLSFYLFSFLSFFSIFHYLFIYSSIYLFYVLFSSQCQ